MIKFICGGCGAVVATVKITARKARRNGKFEGYRYTVNNKVVKDYVDYNCLGVGILNRILNRYLPKTCRRCGRELSLDHPRILSVEASRR